MEPMAGDPSDIALDEIRAKYAERTRLIARKAKKSAGILAVNTVLALMFAEGMPLQSFFQPVGQILLVTWVVAFAFAGMDLVALVGARSLRRDADRIP
jgi:hypothetical protein